MIDIAAITAVIAKDQKVVWTKGFGTADIATQRAREFLDTFVTGSVPLPNSP